MAFSLTSPASAGIKTYGAHGLKIIRLHEYAGSGRATLSVVTDTDSPAGKAVKDTQELAQATTFTGRASSVDDTVSIPIPQLNFDDDASYVGYLGIRVVGRPPVGARAGEEWTNQFLQPGPAIARLHDTSVYDYFHIPRSFYRGYTFIRTGDYENAIFGGADDLIFRAWGITGGSMEFYLDLLYLVPFVLASTDLGEETDADFWPPLQLLTNSNDLGPDEDNNTTNSLTTAHSFMPFRSLDSVWESSVSFDLQDDDVEKTLVDWNSVFFSDPTGLRSFVSAVVGSRSLNAYTIETEDFSAFTGANPGPPVGGLVLTESAQGYRMESASSNWSGNVTNYGGGPYSARFYFFNSCLKFTGPSTPFTLVVPGVANWSVGTGTVRPTPVSGAGASDPRNVAPLLHGLDSFIFTHKVNFLMGHAAGDVEMHFGGGKWSIVNTAHQTRVTNTAKVIHHSDGTHEIALEAYGTNASSGLTVDFASPVTVMPGLSPGGSYWVKIEKRYNHWRARCWVDGDTEPSTWDVEGFAPAWVQAVSLGGVAAVDYPYTATWPNDATLILEDPRYWAGHSTNFTATQWMHEGRLVMTSGFNTINYSIEVAEFTFEYNPDSDNIGSPTGAYYRFEKYDGSEDWGTIYVPPGAWRLLISGYDEHHFASDTHGGNMYAWKETGAEALQVAASSDIFFRRPAKVPQWGDITYP